MWVDNGQYTFCLLCILPKLLVLQSKEGNLMEHRMIFHVFLTTRPTCEAWIVVTSSLATTMQGDDKKSGGRVSSFTSLESSILNGYDLHHFFNYMGYMHFRLELA